MRTSIALAIAMICGTSSVDAQVDNCAELLRLSRTTSRTIMDRRVFTRTVDDFCDEARSARTSNRSLNFDLRVLGIGEGGSSEATTNSAVTKYCREASDEENRALNYQQYLDGIDSGAYGAYAACTAARERDAVQYEMGQAPTRDRLVLGIWNRTNTTGATADLEWSGSDPVTCRWTSDEVTPEERARLKPNERATLECRRSSFDADPIGEQDSVNVIRADGGTAPMLVIPWSKYGSDGNPVMTLDEIRQRLDERLQERVESLQVELALAEEQMTTMEDRLNSLIGRQWYNVTSVRQDDQCYVNNTDYPIDVAITTGAQRGGRNFCQAEIFVEDERIIQQISNNPSYAKQCVVTATVPPRVRYHVNDDGYRSGRVVTWWELRAGGDAIDLQNAQCR